jgi:diguanylate cyclase (GGDEF)-like protein
MTEAAAHLHTPGNLSDSPFARELGVGDARLRFGPEIEAQFQQQHMRRMRLRVRVWFSFVAFASFVLLALLSPVLHMEIVLLRGLTSWIQISVLLTCVALLVWLAWSPRYQHLCMPVARIVVPIYVCVSAIVITQVILAGEQQTLAWLTLFIMATYFFSGLLFRAALLSNVLLALVFITVSVGGHLSFFVLLRALLVLGSTSAICAIVCRDAEQTSRRSFLETALLAEYGTRDGLTGLMNRRAFDEHLVRVWQQALRAGQSLALLMIDVDNLKFYNDTYGHQAGDAMIRNVAQILRGLARRPLDLATRYGGDEFSLVLFDLPLANVEDIAERARRAVSSASPISSAGIPAQLVTVSIGVALVTPMIDRTPEGAIQLADQALYEAKSTGRDRIVLRGVEDYQRFKTGSFRMLARKVQ